jgi:uncharacterized protein (DUF427 family)
MTQRIEPGPDQESVWDYPRPPALEPVEDRLRIEFGGITLADTTGAYRVLETSHPPTYYLPPDDIAMEHLTREPRTTMCEWKGRAVYYSVEVNGKTADHAAWSYPSPTERFTPIADYVAFYAHKMDACYVGDAKVDPQKGGFYGGWVTDRVVGPFKGGPGTLGW